jgi:hypothetical protein
MIGVRCSGLYMPSLSFWACLTRLKVFAIVFSLLLLDKPGATPRTWPAPPSLRHPIENGGTLPSVFVPKLIQAIDCFPNHDTLSLYHTAGALSHRGYGQEEKVAITNLAVFYASQGVRIPNAEGSEIRDIPTL